ncbi:MAG: hypothetical protein LH613_12495 [Chamaesiphon sp.]|nr:hypothetical protein [Chamaesiphon sp.]
MESRSIATASSNSLPPSYRGMETLSTVDTASLMLMSLVILSSLAKPRLWRIAAAIYACIPKVMQPSFRPKLNDKVPCDRCQYFSHNPYIKCALHPDTVLTDRAVDCRDYHSGSLAEPFEE